MKTNTPNPLIPQGSFPDQRGKAHIRIAVFTILAFHMVVFAALLMAGGCKKPADQAGDQAGFTNASFDTANSFTSPPPLSTTAPPVEVAYVPSNPLPPVDTLPLPPSNSVRDIPPAPETEREHTVVKNDSFYVLAKKYNVSIKAIADLNPGVDSKRLKVGQKIKIPPASATPVSARTTPQPTEGGERIHVVKSQETLTSIAKAEHVSVKALTAANNLKTTRIKVGQKLKIPGKAVTAPEPFMPSAASGDGTLIPSSPPAMP